MGGRVMPMYSCTPRLLAIVRLVPLVLATFLNQFLMRYEQSSLTRAALLMLRFEHRPHGEKHSSDDWADNEAGYSKNRQTAKC
jgi:hypothetical protein